MNRTEYLNKLTYELNKLKLPADKTREAVVCCSQYFDEAGIENEQAAIKILGSPKKVAKKILSEYKEEFLDKNVRSIRNNISLKWLIILAIITSPITLPILFSLVVFAISIVFTFVICDISLIFSTFMLIVSGVLCLVKAFGLLFSSVSASIFVFGVGFILISIGVLSTYAMLKFSKWMLYTISNILRKFICKIERKRRGFYEKAY